MNSFGRALATVFLLFTTGALLSGCGGSTGSSTAAAAGLATQKVTAGSVEVTAVPQRIDKNGAQFAIPMDNHMIDLNADMMKSATLTVDGRTWAPTSWSGSNAGGHHREGTMSFTAAGAPSGQARLSIGGLPQPAVFNWKLPPAAAGS